MPSLPDPDSLTDLDERERRVYGRFLNKVGDGPAAFFLDACRMMRANPRPAAASHLVGHSIREIESAVRALLVPLARSSQASQNVRIAEIHHMLMAANIGEWSEQAEWWYEVAKEKGGQTQREQINAVVTELGVAETDPIAATWHRLSGAAKAHRPGLRVRPVDAEFEQYWVDTVALFDALLDRFERRFLSYIDTLDKLLAIRFPSREDVARLDERVPRNVTTYKYFFERLESPDWFAPLRRKGFFNNPFSWYWPPAVYLRKIAGRFPTEVLQVLIGIETDSPVIRAEFAAAVLSMPIAHASRWGQHEVAWIARQKRIGWLLPAAYGKVVAHLAVNGDSDTALVMIETILGDGGEQQDAAIRVVQEPAGKLEWYELERFTADVMPALARSPAKTLPRLIALLATILSSERTIGWDASRYWRSSIAQDRGLVLGRRNALVTAIRDVALEALRGSAMRMPDVLDLLDAQQHPIFIRLARFLLAQFPAGMGDRIMRELGDLDLLLDEEHGEYRHLARAGFAHLNADGRADFLRRLTAGPDTAEFRERVMSVRGTAPTDDVVHAYVLRWQTSIGALVTDAAGEEFRQAHHGRVAELAALDAARNAPAVPLRSSAELRDLTPDELVAYIRDFLAAPNPEGSRDEELGMHVQQAVAADPERLTAGARAFTVLPPAFVGRIIAGVADSLKNALPVRWDSLLELIEFALTQKVGAVSGERREQTWMCTRQHVAWLMVAVFRAETVAIPPTLAARVDGVIMALLDAMAADEALFHPEAETVADRAVVRAMNSVHGQALEAAAEFILWARAVAPDEAARCEQSLLDLSERLLDAQSPTLHAAFGHAFGTFLQIDEEWVKRNLGRILPDPASAPDIWEAAFAGIVGYWVASAQLLELLRTSYAHAIRRLQTDAAYARSIAADRVAQHLAVLYWSGRISLDDPLLMDFFARAPGKLRGRLQWRIAAHLDASNGTVDADVQRRLDELWTRRIIDGAALDDRADELSWFSFYYEVHRGDPAWAARSLKIVLEAGVTMNDHRVLEKLARFAQEDPVLAFECYTLLLENDRKARFMMYEERGRDILRAALASPVADAARDLIHALGSDGILTFRDLVDESQSDS